MNVNLRHLEAFAAVARLGSFTAAARQLNISQPALTVQIRQLEESLTVRLLDRNTRSVRLTRIGRELAPRVERLLADMESMVASAKDLSQRARGVVRIAALPSIASTLLPRVIVSFRKQYPGISLVLRDVAASRVTELVLSEDVDLGLGSSDASHPDLSFTPLFTDHMCLVLPAASPLLARRQICLQDVAVQSLILPEPGSSVRLLVDRAFVALGLKVTPAYEVALMSTVAGMVRAGLGAAILPAASLEMGELKGLRARPLTDRLPAREIGVLRKAGRTLSPAAESFLAGLLAHPAVKALQRGPRRRHS